MLKVEAVAAAARGLITMDLSGRTGAGARTEIRSTNRPSPDNPCRRDCITFLVR